MSATASVRRLGPAEVEAYRALMLEAYGNDPEAFTSSVAERAALPLSWWENRLDPAPDAQEMNWGAFVDGQLVGVVGLGFMQREKERHKAHLFGMYVQPAQRGLRLGRALVTAALEGARARNGVRVVSLTVTEGNAPAEALYARCGFERFGVEPMAVCIAGRDFSKVHMVCKLESGA
ncbi:ribosomal protein S18 acetylase RimI-like enzyme [Inhella inkyongensis]|uniref:Ribosomal protein S18 acetylase RimI-like enzyme n=1 Tax=Inhella inkyongensis TaxID=392593 RepID=A0A840S8K2_9BURK|nr:GNAT family N-acetyltransferase [Inhella inkyongensis]MBB5205124.1 ribosomal protein S18 acetylase RimI-like enzyme [Inhella inkyongensis]